MPPSLNVGDQQLYIAQGSDLDLGGDGGGVEVEVEGGVGLAPACHRDDDLTRRGNPSGAGGVGRLDEKGGGFDIRVAARDDRAPVLLISPVPAQSVVGQRSWQRACQTMPLP